MASTKKFLIARKWRQPRIMIALMAIELPLTVAFLTLSGIADDDLYRTKLWRIGSDNGFNSNPNELLYAAANYRPIPTPLIWGSFLTQFNIVISVLSMFILLVKSAMFTMHAFIPLLSVVAHLSLVVLFAVGIRNQSASDMSDPQHPSPGLAWYLTKGCSYADGEDSGYCMQARASFAVTIVMFALFVVYSVYSIWSSIPTELERAQRAAQRQSDIEMKQMDQYEDEELSREEAWMRNNQVFLNLPKTPNTPGFGGLNPMTPRTTAFAKLSGGELPLPKKPVRLEAGPSIAGPSNTSPSTTSPTRGLPFREQYGSDSATGGK